MTSPFKDNVDLNMDRLINSMEKLLEAAELQNFDMGSDIGAGPRASFARSPASSFARNNPPMGGAIQGSLKHTAPKKAESTIYDMRTTSDIDFEEPTAYGGASFESQSNGTYDHAKSVHGNTSQSNGTYDHAKSVHGNIQTQNGNRSPDGVYDHLNMVTQQPQPMAIRHEEKYATAAHNPHVADPKSSPHSSYNHAERKHAPEKGYENPQPHPEVNAEQFYATFDGTLDTVPQLRKLDNSGHARRPTVSTEDSRRIRKALSQGSPDGTISREGRGPAGGHGNAGPTPTYDLPEGHKGYEMAHLHKDYEVADPHRGDAGHDGSLRKQRVTRYDSQMSATATEMAVYEPLSAYHQGDQTKKPLASWGGGARKDAAPARRGQSAHRAAPPRRGQQEDGDSAHRAAPPQRGQQEDGASAHRAAPPRRGQQHSQLGPDTVTQQPSPLHSPVPRSHRAPRREQSEVAPYEPIVSGALGVGGLSAGPVPQPRPSPRLPRRVVQSRQYAVGHDVHEESDI